MNLSKETITFLQECVYNIIRHEMENEADPLPRFLIDGNNAKFGIDTEKQGLQHLVNMSDDVKYELFRNNLINLVSTYPLICTFSQNGIKTMLEMVEPIEMIPIENQEAAKS